MPNETTTRPYGIENDLKTGRKAVFTTTPTLGEIHSAAFDEFRDIPLHCLEVTSRPNSHLVILQVRSTPASGG
ncbi:MAG: hypothetical protein AAB407_01650 [Patescibacteria group bacterium]